MRVDYTNPTKYIDAVHKKAVRLLEGGHEEICGHLVRARKQEKLPPGVEYSSPCFDCAMDCICRDLMTDVCNELDTFNKGTYYLELVL